jgi:catalase
MSDERPVTTTDAGIPAASDEFSLTAGPSGPTVLHDHYVVQKMQHFNRERVPERVVHAKGSGAHGFFEVTEDVTRVDQGELPGGCRPAHARVRALLHRRGRAGQPGHLA